MRLSALWYVAHASYGHMPHAFDMKHIRVSAFRSTLLCSCNNAVFRNTASKPAWRRQLLTTTAAPMTLPRSPHSQHIYSLAAFVPSCTRSLFSVCALCYVYHPRPCWWHKLQSSMAHFGLCRLSF